MKTVETTEELKKRLCVVEESWVMEIQHGEQQEEKRSQRRRLLWGLEGG